MQNNENLPFDPFKALAELHSGIPNRAVRKLSFPEKCGIFAALQKIPHPTSPGAFLPSTFSHANVCAAFDISQTTVSLLAHCLTSGKHYGEVAREFERLGQLEFCRRYYTHDIHVMLSRGKHEHAETAYGPNPKATKYAFAGGGRNQPFGAFEVENEWFRVDWVNDGWYWTGCAENGGPLEHGYRYTGTNGYGAIEPKPFERAPQAYRNCWIVIAGKDPLRGGRNKSTNQS
jgi:hypothetical protein